MTARKGTGSGERRGSHHWVLVVALLAFALYWILMRGDASLEVDEYN